MSFAVLQRRTEANLCYKKASRYKTFSQSHDCFSYDFRIGSNNRSRPKVTEISPNLFVLFKTNKQHVKNKNVLTNLNLKETYNRKKIIDSVKVPLQTTCLQLLLVI